MGVEVADDETAAVEEHEHWSRPLALGAVAARGPAGHGQLLDRSNGDDVLGLDHVDAHHPKPQARRLRRALVHGRVAGEELEHGGELRVERHARRLAATAEGSSANGGAIHAVRRPTALVRGPNATRSMSTART